jgi:hypothetical protein
VSARRRLRHNLALHLLGFYLLFIVPILAVALFFDNQASRRLEADVSAADLSLAEAIALETNALLLKAQQAVEAFAQMPAVIDMDLAGMETAYQPLLPAGCQRDHGLSLSSRARQHRRH